MYSNEFQSCSMERLIVQSVLKKVGIRFLNTDPVFLFCMDMACVSHWAALMFMLLCWYPECCRATSLEIKVEDRQGREYWCKSKTSKLTFQISVATEKSIVFLSSYIFLYPLITVHFSNLCKSPKSLHREVTKHRTDMKSVCLEVLLSWCIFLQGWIGKQNCTDETSENGM